MTNQTKSALALSTEIHNRPPDNDRRPFNTRAGHQPQPRGANQLTVQGHPYQYSPNPRRHQYYSQPFFSGQRNQSAYNPPSSPTQPSTQTLNPSAPEFETPHQHLISNIPKQISPQFESRQQGNANRA
jgi:hypothetical protein